ncbi:MAG: hypothetical protein H6Q75_681 [Firmicutes bacterium]|nr:hypothetical protein [Bacillota bacterium]
MLSAKELLHLEDFLNAEQTCVKTLEFFANQTNDSQAKQMFQQMAQKNQQNYQTISRHLNAGQNLQ